MEKKTYSVVMRYRLFSALSWIGVVIAVVGYFMDGLPKQILPWIGLVTVIIAVVLRFTAVRCPHCGHLLTESKKIPAQCPKCDEELH